MTDQIIIFFQIVLIDLVLAGDNAIIIGMVASQFPTEQRKKIIFWGIAAAVILRIIFTLITAYLLQITTKFWRSQFVEAKMRGLTKSVSAHHLEMRQDGSMPVLEKLAKNNEEIGLNRCIQKLVWATVAPQNWTGSSQGVPDIRQSSIELRSSAD